MQKESIEYYKALLGPVIGTLILSIIFFHHKGIYWITYIPLSIGFIGLAFPSLGIYFIRFLEAVKNTIGKILNGLLLTTVFYLMLTPLALIRKMTNKKSNTPSVTQFIERNKTFAPEDFEKPW